MVEGKDDEAVMNVNSKTGFDSLRIIKDVDRLLYQRHRHGGRTSRPYYGTYNLH